MHLCDATAAQAATRPDAPAIERWPGGVLTYAALWDRIRIAGAVLRSQGVGPGATVGLLVADPVDHLIAFLATTLVGACAVPLESPGAEAAAAHVLAALDCRVFVDDRGAGGAGRRLLPDALRHTPSSASLPTPADLDDRHPCNVAFSSGTTGRPKAVFQTHHRQTASLAKNANRLPTGEDERTLMLVGMGFAMGRMPALRTIAAGGLVIVPAVLQDEDDLVAILRDTRPTALTVTPLHVRDLLRIASRTTERLVPTLRFLQVSSAITTVAERTAARRLLTPNLFVSYGMNEVGIVSIAGPEDLDRHPATVGRAMPHAAIEIVDGAGSVLPPGQIGEVRVRALGMPAGYIADPDPTARSFREGWFHPGDIGLLDADGYLFLHGRTDDVINVGGVKVYPPHLEAILARHPAVAEAAVIAWPSRRLQEVPLAAVVLRGPVAERALIRLCAAEVGPYRAPRRVVVLAELPRNAAGKVVPAVLRERLGPLLDRRGD